MDQFTPLRSNDRSMPTGQGRWQVGERAVRTPCAKSGVEVTLLCVDKEMQDQEIEDHRCEGRSLLIFSASLFGQSEQGPERGKAGANVSCMHTEHSQLYAANGTQPTVRSQRYTANRTQQDTPTSHQRSAFTAHHRCWSLLEAFASAFCFCMLLLYFLPDRFV